MLSSRQAFATLPTDDPQRLRRFYEDVLGLVPRRESPMGVYYEAGGGSVFTITRSGGRPSGQHTQMAFLTDDIAGDVAQLRDRGVAFEAYDLPNIRTVDGIAKMPAGRAAWFHDPDGNLLGIIEFDAAEG
jgi:catechol 2,3-dioxygenase-like lactoylglutathione lyase family enzyme